MSEAPGNPLEPHRDTSETASAFARRPNVSEKEFSDMRVLGDGRFVDANDPLLKGNEDLVYVSKKDGKLYFPNFMVAFLYDEYAKKWLPDGGGYRDWEGRGHITKLSSILVPDSEDPITSTRFGYTTGKRIRDRYRAEQIKRMSPDERATALAEDEALGATGNKEL